MKNVPIFKSDYLINCQDKRQNYLFVAALNDIISTKSVHTHADAFQLFIDKELKQSWL